MTIPARGEAARLLTSLGPPPWFVRHACAVADVAGWIARRTLVAGGGIDVRTVDAAALLHDVDKLPAAAMTGLRHGDGSAAWLQAAGMAELAPVVRDHPVTRLAEPGFPTWLRTASPEARIVAYADKRAGQRLESMDQRFASWRRRYPAGPVPEAGAGSDGRATGDGWDDEIARRVRERALHLERVVCEAAGVRPEEVRRLRWAGRAMASATR
jgi:hypothetical protein